MSEDQDHIDRLTPAVMQQYLKGTLSSDMQHQVERYLLDHPFEAEAMEGFEVVEAANLSTDIAKMKKGLYADKKKVKVIPIWQQYWKVAAVVTVLIVSTFLILNLGQDPLNTHRRDLALEKSVNSEAMEDAVEDTLEKEDAAPEVVETIDKIDKKTSEKIDKSLLASTINTEPKQANEEELVGNVNEEKHAEIIVAEEVNNAIVVAEAFADEESVSDVQKFAKAEEITHSKASKQQETDVLSMIESEDVEAAAAVRKEITPERMGFNVVDALKGKVPEVSISSVVQDSSVNIVNDRTIKGKITSAEDGISLPGVNIILKGANEGTISDAEGNYEIEIPEGQKSMVVSFIGYVKEEVEIGDDNVIDVAMSADVSALSEVVVTGYGKARRTKSAGYSTSKKKTIRKQDAEPIMGFESYNKYLQDALRYPQQAIDNEITGKIILEVSVDKTGAISMIEVKQGLGYGCDEEAIRLIKEGSEWRPAIKRGNPVEESVRIEVAFME